jgi:hypothetical protein
MDTSKMTRRQRTIANAIPLYLKEMEEAQARYEATGAEHHLIRAQELAKSISFLEVRVGA